MSHNSAAAALESVSCDLCGANDSAPVRQLTDRMFATTDEVFRLVRCRRCGLLYLNPRPPTSDVGRYYRDDYAPFARRGVSARIKSLTFEREVAGLWPLLAPPARVIDVGCATGELLRAVRGRGNPNVLGIEPSHGAATIARQRWLLDVITGTLEAANLPSGSVDTALLSHTAEHLPSPSGTFAELHRVLRTDGSVVLWVPNAASLAARLLGDRWIGYDAPRHFYSYTPATLSEILTRHGFAIRSVRHEWIGLEWSWALRLWLRDRSPGSKLNSIVGVLHPALTAAFTPIAALAAIAKQGGRIRVVAQKTD